MHRNPNVLRARRSSAPTIVFVVLVTIGALLNLVFGVVGASLLRETHGASGVYVVMSMVGLTLSLKALDLHEHETSGT